MRTKSLTLKSPNKVKLITLIFVISFILFPSVRYTSADVLRSTASLISPQWKSTFSNTAILNKPRLLLQCLSIKQLLKTLVILLVTNSFKLSLFNDTFILLNMIRYEVRFQTPYNNQEWRSQFFNTLKEAESMVRFYLSCGSKSYMV